MTKGMEIRVDINTTTIIMGLPSGQPYEKYDIFIAQRSHEGFHLNM